MSAIYFLIVVFLLGLAIFDLFVGVSNDAVNFLQSAVGARVAKFRTILLIASLGVILGAAMSSGMMDVARHGMMMPQYFSFEDVMTLFLAVMVTDIIILDVFNTLGMPTSTTVSLVFELLGGAFVLATIKVLGDESMDYSMLLNSGKALSVIIAIFDLVRASVNLVLASMLIIIGTNYKLPLSTTYVTFMVAMGTSLADKAWSRESAVFRVTGVISVIGGWFITAGVAFISCSLICLAMYYGGIWVKLAMIALVIVLLVRSNRNFNKKASEVDKSAATFRLMMRTRDPQLVWELLYKQVSRTQSFMTRFALHEYNLIMDALAAENAKVLRKAEKELQTELQLLKNFRRREMLGLKRCPMDVAIERNTWFHLGANSNQQFVYSLRRMLEPIKEHVENNFHPLPALYIEEFRPVRQTINDLMKQSGALIETGRYQNYREILAEADNCKDLLSVIRKGHIDRIQKSQHDEQLKVSLLYLNILQESQEFLSVMRHQLRAAKKFMEN